MKNKIPAVFVVLLNLAGIACLVFFAVLFLSHDPTVRNPDAMIPFQNWEAGGMALTAGVLPLLFANGLGFLLLRGYRGKQKRFLLCFLPAVLCAALAAVYWIGSPTWWS